MDKFDWSRFALRINVRATTESLYKAWSTRLGIESWFLRLADFRGPDGQPKHIGYKTGWTFYLANLKSILEGGIDLRNRNPDAGEMLNK